MKYTYYDIKDLIHNKESRVAIDINDLGKIKDNC